MKTYIVRVTDIKGHTKVIKIKAAFEQDAFTKAMNMPNVMDAVVR